MLQPSDFATSWDYVAAVKALPEAPCTTGECATDPAMMAEQTALFNLVPRSDATFVAVKDGSWFDPATWDGGVVPGAGAKVLIPEAISVHYDGVSDTSLFTVRVDG